MTITADFSHPATAALAEWITCMRKQRIKGALGFTQKTWQSNCQAAQCLTVQALNMQDWQQVDIYAGTSVGDSGGSFTFPVVVNGNVEDVRRVVVVCEKEAYDASLDGDWGMNPTSIMKARHFSLSEPPVLQLLFKSLTVAEELQALGV